MAGRPHRVRRLSVLVGAGLAFLASPAADSSNRWSLYLPASALAEGAARRPLAPRPLKSRKKAAKKARDGIASATPAALRTAQGGAIEAARVASIENSETAHTPGVSATIDNLTFQNGDVPHARAALERIKKDFAKCAATEPGPANGTAEFRFIVRAPGRAEGVDVARVRGVSANIVRCATSALTLRSVGAPSADPVGVTLNVRFGNP
jgi:hypothetical protein